MVERDGAGCPRALGSPGGEGDGEGDGPRLVDAVLEVWRIDDEWWRRPIARRYFEALLQGGRRVVLFEDLATGEWFEQTP